jgi:predicted Zn-dependent peptidase
MMPKRPVPPRIKDIVSLKFPELEKRHLMNGAPYYWIDSGTQEVVRIEIAFRAGHIYEQTPLVAGAAIRLLKEGTHHYSAAQIAEQLDFYGCTLHLVSGLDTSSIVLYCLSKQLDKALPILEEMLAAPQFPEAEVAAYKKRRIRQLAIDLNQNDEVADRRFTELVFGPAHPYGYNGSEQGYRSLTRKQIQDHFHRLYNQANCTLFVSGRLREGQLKKIDECLSRSIPEGKASPPVLPVLPATPSRALIKMPGTLQTSIRIGRRLFTRHHEDYQGMYVLNTILGGYFGSRLMANLREDKGYTYNVYSAIDTMQYGGSFQIGTETAVDYAEEAREQIYIELKTLAEQLVTDEEMRMVRNYLQGTFLGMLDGPFKLAKLARSMAMDGLPFYHFNQLAETVRSISSEELRALAAQYFEKESLWEVIVGP